MSSLVMLRMVTITRGRVRLSTWPLRASVRLTPTEAAITGSQLVTSTPPSCDNRSTEARAETSAARLPSTVLPLPWDQRTLPTADPAKIIVKLRVRVRVRVKVKVKSQKSKLDPEVGSVMG